jgi:hypothetical protein
MDSAKADKKTISKLLEKEDCCYITSLELGEIDSEGSPCGGVMSFSSFFLTRDNKSPDRETCSGFLLLGFRTELCEHFLARQLSVGSCVKSTS